MSGVARPQADLLVQPIEAADRGSAVQRRTLMRGKSEMT
jgi:hypothetical protein